MLSIIFKRFLDSLRFRTHRLLCQIGIAQTIHIVSDSHGLVFSNIEKRFLKLNLCTVHGATLTGLSNPNSKTKALPKFKKYINSKIRKNDFVFVQLGEVDCGFVLWHQAEKNNGLIKLDRVISNYENLVNLILSKNKNSQRIILMSSILPTIGDGEVFGEVSNLRKEIKASQIERTKLSLNLNKEIKKISFRYNCIFLDLDKYCYNPKSETIFEELKHKDKGNHHLDEKKLIQIIKQEIYNLNLKNILLND